MLRESRVGNSLGNIQPAGLPGFNKIVTILPTVKSLFFKYFTGQQCVKCGNICNVSEIPYTLASTQNNCLFLLQCQAYESWNLK